MRDAGRWIGTREIDSREHVRIDGTFAVQEEFEISRCGDQFRLRKPFDETMKLEFVRHRDLFLAYDISARWLWVKASLHKTST